MLLERMGLPPPDLAASQPCPEVPTFAEYVPVVSAAVSAGTRRAYGSYWNRVVEHWGGRRLDEPTPSEIRQLMSYVKTHVVARRNARGGRSAEEHLVAALRCLYKRAVDSGLINEADNPAQKVAKAAPPADHPPGAAGYPADADQRGRRDRGRDPELDTLILRLHTETAVTACPQRAAVQVHLNPAGLCPQKLERLQHGGDVPPLAVTADIGLAQNLVW